MPGDVGGLDTSAGGSDIPFDTGGDGIGAGTVCDRRAVFGANFHSHRNSHRNSCIAHCTAITAADLSKTDWRAFPGDAAVGSAVGRA